LKGAFLTTSGAQTTTAAAEHRPAVRWARDRDELGRAAAGEIAATIIGLLERQSEVRIIFACAPSQATTMAELAVAPGIDWSRVVAFHMDEYIGLAADAPQLFSRWLKQVLLDRVPVGKAHLIVPGDDPDADCRAYGELLAEGPIDIACLGIGVNGHIAFNDPPADFSDPVAVKVVELSLESRRQQVDDDCFDELGDVPHQAITLTVPRLLAVDRMFCMVPGEEKRAALTAALYGPIDPLVPATALRTHPDCTIYLDAGSAPQPSLR
jgi:glucosamine-6-phosphate deaminase